MAKLIHMILGVPRETHPGEKRVALIPESIPKLEKVGIKVAMQEGAGEPSGFLDAAYQEKGASLKPKRADVFAEAELILAVRGPSPEEVSKMREGQALVCMLNPFNSVDLIKKLADRKVVTFALEFMPRITRAQTMDVLSSMSSIAGYKAVLLAANHLPKIFPLMMTAAGTVLAAKVLVIGAGVAGLQAIATARKLGALVEAYDVRAAVKEQIQSLGAKFVELPLETAGAEGAGGYAKEQGEDFLRRQRELMARVVAASDVVICTAAIPGKQSPVIVTADMVCGMRPGSVIVDLAAERGGNCELTSADATVVEHEVTILGPTNLPATVPHHASQLYAKNVVTFLQHLLKDGALQIDLADEITRETLLVRDGEIAHARVRALLGAAPAATS